MIIDSELEICPAYGWQGGPEFNTLIKPLRSGHERRRALWEYAKHRFVLPFQNITDANYLMHLKSVFMAARGSANAFWVKDRSDYRAEDTAFGLGDGVETEFDLLLNYQFGIASYARRILYPVDPVFFVNGSHATATFDPVTKRVIFSSAPDDGDVLTWTGEFRILVRFAADTLPMTIDNRSGQHYAMNGSVELVEVWE